MQQWFNNLPRREQIILLVGGGAVLLYIVFMIILAPMSEAVANLKQQNMVAAATLVEVQQLSGEYQRLQKNSSKPRQSGGNLTRIIDSSVKNNQLMMSRFQPSSRGDVQVRFENAVFNHILSWLNEMESEHSIMVKDLTIGPGSGSGLVNVSVRLYRS